MRVLILAGIEWASIGVGGALFAAGVLVLIVSLRTTGQLVAGYKSIADELRRERDEARRERDECREDLERIEEGRYGE